MARTKKTTTAPTTELTAAEQDRIARPVTPICRKCGRDLTPDQIGSSSREGKMTCRECLGTVPPEPTVPAAELQLRSAASGRERGRLLGGEATRAP